MSGKRVVIKHTYGDIEVEADPSSGLVDLWTYGSGQGEGTYAPLYPADAVRLAAALQDAAVEQPNPDAPQPEDSDADLAYKLEQWAWDEAQDLSPAQMALLAEAIRRLRVQ